MFAFCTKVCYTEDIKFSEVYAVRRNNKQIVFQFLQKRAGDGLPPTVREICDATGIRSTSTVHGILKSLADEGLIVHNAQSSRGIQIKGQASTMQVPVLGRVTAGLPILAVEEIEEYITYSGRVRAGAQLFALHVVGESMKNAGILDGDLVICEKAETVEDGTIAVALIEDEATVKRVFREGRGVRLQPENDAFDPIYAAEVMILGRVIASMRTY